MLQLATFDRDDVGVLGDEIRDIAKAAASLEEAAMLVVDALYDALADGDRRACVLVRLYVTLPYGELSEDLQAFARTLVDEELDHATRCLTLLATRGEEDAWNDPARSQGHRAIPLPSVEFVQRLPMVHALIHQLGLDPADVVAPDARRVLQLSQQTYDVFHVPHAPGSEVLPAQDFVAKHGVSSALGFGGVLYSGDFYAVVLFSRVPISDATARYLRILALATRVALTPFSRRRRGT